MCAEVWRVVDGSTSFGSFEVVLGVVEVHGHFLRV